MWQPPDSNKNDRAWQGINADAMDQLQTRVTTPVRITFQGQKYPGEVSWDGTSCSIRDATGATVLDFHPDELITYTASLTSISLETTRGSCILHFGSWYTQMLEYFSVGSYGKPSSQLSGDKVQHMYGTGVGTWTGLIGWMWVSTGRNPPRTGSSYSPFTVMSPGSRNGDPSSWTLGFMLAFVVFLLLVSVLLYFAH
ncbi:MAG: hypothetical protein ACP5OR_08550 [Candidatus Dormibacteria bacterium]